ncbi:hypothetical protein [Bacteroides acidifaciens]|uniref:hypothetical protein n=1 Tax=Bacteroides acidifaciens TaxID=85831 RepID=UPI0025ADC2AF|nr:hypothetical protein [Bacteroides acidifaciens]
MGYSNKTQNFELPQWVGSDKPKWLTDMNTAFSTIDNTMETNIEQTNLANQKADNNTSAINQINQTIAEIQGDSTQLEAQVEANTNNIALHTTHLNDHDSNINEMRTDINTNMGDIAALQADITTLQNEVGTGGGESSTSLSAQVTALRNDVDVLNADVGSVSSLQTTAKTVVGGINEILNATPKIMHYTMTFNCNASIMGPAVKRVSLSNAASSGTPGVINMWVASTTSLSFTNTFPNGNYRVISCWANTTNATITTSAAQGHTESANASILIHPPKTINVDGNAHTLSHWIEGVITAIIAPKAPWSSSYPPVTSGEINNVTITYAVIKI